MSVLKYFTPPLFHCPPRSASPCPVQDCLSLFFEQTVLTGGDQKSCSVCGQRRDTVVFTRLDKPPEILILHLKRWVDIKWIPTASVQVEGDLLHDIVCVMRLYRHRGSCMKSWRVMHQLCSILTWVTVFRYCRCQTLQTNRLFISPWSFTAVLVVRGRTRWNWGLTSCSPRRSSTSPHFCPTRQRTTAPTPRTISTL